MVGLLRFHQQPSTLSSHLNAFLFCLCIRWEEAKESTHLHICTSSHHAFSVSQSFLQVQSCRGCLCNTRLPGGLTPGAARTKHRKFCAEVVWSGQLAMVKDFTRDNLGEAVSIIAGCTKCRGLTFINTVQEMTANKVSLDLRRTVGVKTAIH